MSRWAVRGAGTGIAALVALGIAPGVASAAPSNADVAAAQAARDAAAAQVGQLSAELATAQAAAAQAGQDAQIALQDYQETEAALEEARAAQAAAQAAADQAQDQLAEGRATVASFARSSYMQGTTSPGITALVTSGGPAELLERAALLDAAGTHHVDVVDQLTVLEAQATTAEQQATAAADEAGELEAQAADQLASAQSQEISARAQTAALADQQAVVEQQLAAADATVDQLTTQQQQAAAAAAAAAAAQQAARPAPSAPAAVRPAPQTTSTAGSGPTGGESTGTGTGSGSGSSSTPAPVQTTVGAPSGSRVQTAIDAARSQRGVSYAWGGGSTRGPGPGMDPDEGVIGFDCSSLTQYAYAQAGVSLPRTSREQFNRFSDSTVARADLQAGDLVFWASGSSSASIYHVALYLGGGRIIAAPQSGDVVREMNMYFGADYFGAVRPTA